MNRQSHRARWISSAALLGAATFVAATVTTPATADQAPTPRKAAAADEGTVLGVYEHLFRFEEIADDNGGNRASGLPGYRASKNYVVRKLQRAGYEPEVQAFEFPFFQQTGPSTFQLAGSEPAVEDEDYSLMTYSGNGTATGDLTPVDLELTTPNASTSGCEDTDFAGFPAGEIALLQRGTCPFGDKVINAQEAGAAAAVLMNQGNTDGADRQDLFSGTLGAPVDIPAISVSYPTGQELASTTPEATVTAQTDSRIATTWNVTADSKGNRQNVVMAGAHLDSVPEGNGINDNGTGSAALLETAEAMADMKRKPTNRVRFAWWGAEELGLLGSEHYVADMVENQPAKFRNIALYLNYDMVGSPNYKLGVYDGDNNAFPPEVSAPAPEGSAAIERMYVRFFEKLGTGSVPTEFSGRSDYGPFISENVPAGGLFTGAEGLKTEEEAELFGGTAGVAYDPNYHQVGDTIGNVNRRALTANLAAIRYAMAKYARSTRSVNGDATGHQPPTAEARERTRAAIQANEHDHAHAHDHNDVVAR